MSKLTSARIAGLASRPNVKAIAVENFLATVENNASQEYALCNLAYDAKLYRWNAATVAAIRTGILEYFASKK